MGDNAAVFDDGIRTMAFGGAPSPPPPAPLPPAPTLNDAATANAAAAQEQEVLRRQQQGRASTILNGGQGLSDLGSTTSASQLLGG
jgi:hypothetical protein